MSEARSERGRMERGAAKPRGRGSGECSRGGGGIMGLF